MAMVEWDDIEPPKKGFGSGKKSGSNAGRFKKLEANSTNRVRPVFKPIRFYKYFNRKDGQLRSAITEDPDTCTVKAKYPDLRAQKRYACLILDRDDENKLKILEGPATLFDNFKAFKKMAKEDPGGPKGGDFEIKVICPNGKKDRDTTYEVDFVEAVPFTEEEKNFIREHKEEYDLEEIFQALEPDRIEQLLFGDSDNNDSNDSEQAVASSSSSNQSTADDDDPFNF